MEDITPIILLSTVFCGLVVVLYLYGRFMQFLHQRSPPVNKLKLENWLLDNNVILPTKEKIIIEFNVLADGISSIDGGVVSQCVCVCIDLIIAAKLCTIIFHQLYIIIYIYTCHMYIHVFIYFHTIILEEFEFVLISFTII